jgi:transcriptional regulator with XRE-family HTH domain
MDRRETVARFRQRLQQVLRDSGASQAAFARRIGLDRSTLSQLLDQGQDRLPRAETIVAIAEAAQVSVDWLLGLTQSGSVGPELVQRALEIAEGSGQPGDERLLAWHAEAAGYRIRYVPATLPDLLKTEALIRYEYARFGTPVSEARIDSALARLALIRRPDSDLEMASPLQDLWTFAEGRGLWREMPWAQRRDQLEAMARLTRELYPGLRWFLFDGLKRYSVAFTLFGPLRAAVYFGNMYFVFNATEQVRVLAGHFDELIRAAAVQPPDVPALIEQLIRDNEPATSAGGRRVARRVTQEKKR